MTIPTVKEPPGFASRFKRLLENCCFCEAPTVYWYKKKKSVPICPMCANRHSVDEVPTKEEWWNTSVKGKDDQMKNIVFFDVETSGLDPQKHDIIQLAAVVMKTDGEIVESFEAKLEFDISQAQKKALEINHYDEGVWKEEALTSVEALDKFTVFIRKYADVERKSRYGKSFRTCRMGAYNASFDMKFLEAWYKKHNKFMPADYQALDPMQLAIWNSYIQGQKGPASFKLSDVCKYYGVKLEGAHDALADVEATAKLAKALMREMQDE